VATGLLLSCLHTGGHVARRGEAYRLTRSSRRWLDPASSLSVARFVSANADYWTWWSSLAEVTRTGERSATTAPRRLIRTGGGTSGGSLTWPG